MTVYCIINGWGWVSKKISNITFLIWFCKLNTAFELLRNKPEKEQELLALLVNKLGDPERKVSCMYLVFNSHCIQQIAAKAMFLLQSLITDHPAMKAVIIDEVQRLIQRPKIADRCDCLPVCTLKSFLCRAIYYAVLFLNQLYLSDKEHAIASSEITLIMRFAVF